MILLMLFLSLNKICIGNFNISKNLIQGGVEGGKKI